jgi:hypothetical protein
LRGTPVSCHKFCTRVYVSRYETYN